MVLRSKRWPQILRSEEFRCRQVLPLSPLSIRRGPSRSESGLQSAASCYCWDSASRFGVGAQQYEVALGSARGVAVDQSISNRTLKKFATGQLLARDRRCSAVGHLIFGFQLRARLVCLCCSHLRAIGKTSRRECDAWRRQSQYRFR